MRRALAAASMLCLAAAAASQTLDLTVPKVTEGVIASIREVGAVSRGAAAPKAAPSPGSPSEIEQSPPVGAVVYLPFGGSSGGGASSDKTWRFGAAGTPEMQARFAQSAYEVVVVMEDGERRTFLPREAMRFHVGQRVSVRSGELEAADKAGI